MTDLPDLTLRDLLNRIDRGDDSALERLYRHYRRSLYAFVRHQIPDDAAADEIADDVFLVVLRKPTAFNGSSSFHTWLCGIARNRCRDWWRKRGREDERSVAADGYLDSLAAADWQVLERLERDERDAAVRECIDRLPAAHRETVYWSIYEELSIDDVGARMNCPPGTVKSRLFHARAKLRDCIEGALGPEIRRG
jgi:RNA polymerase sigma-70 factor (ECF subfamily)